MFIDWIWIVSRTPPPPPPTSPSIIQRFLDRWKSSHRHSRHFLGSRSFLLLLEERQEGDVGHFDDLESNTWKREKSWRSGPLHAIEIRWRCRCRRCRWSSRGWQRALRIGRTGKITVMSSQYRSGQVWSGPVSDLEYLQRRDRIARIPRLRLRHFPRCNSNNRPREESYVRTTYKC